MSGSPKYSSAELADQQRQRLEEERRRRATEEARLRAEAAERERKQRLEKLKNQVTELQKSVTTKIQQRQSSMSPQDASALIQRCQSHTSLIFQAQDECRLQNIVTELNQILNDCEDAVARKRREDEEKKRKEDIDRLKFEIEELEREVARISKDDAIKFDEPGQNDVNQSIRSVRDALATRNPNSVKVPLNNAIMLVKQHSEKVTQRRSEWEKRRASATEVVGQIQELVTGLKADPVVMRWHSHSVSELEQELQQANQVVNSEKFDLPTQILIRVREKEKQIIHEANIAQLKADQRDYIIQSMIKTFQEMGLSILAVEEEHIGHSATAKIFTAVAAGRAISVSVPVEGQIWYDVDGYPKTTVASLADGNPAAICDEAEKVLNEMHNALEREFGIQMSEVTWQGKDPNRITITATDLPKNQGQAKGNNR